MRAVIQRVSAADVVVNGGAPRAIGRGLMILLGVRDTDTLDGCEKLAQKCAGLRIFRWRRMKHSWPSCEKQAWPVWRRVNSVPI